LSDSRQYRDSAVAYYPTDAEIKETQAATIAQVPGLQLWFNDILAKNIFIGLVRPMHDGQIKLDCREHYTKLGYRVVKIYYKMGENCVKIVGEGVPTKDGYLFLPLHNISSMGIDVED
jgi:hypothetical protein